MSATPLHLTVNDHDPLRDLAGHGVDRPFRQPVQALPFFTASLPTGGG